MIGDIIVFAITFGVVSAFQWWRIRRVVRRNAIWAFRTIERRCMPPTVHDRGYDAAIHEAGHVVAAWHGVADANVKRVVVKRHKGELPDLFSGHVLMMRPFGSPVVPDIIVVYLAGIAAQVAHYGRVGLHGAVPDIHAAIEIATLIVSRYGDPAGGPAETPWPRDELEFECLPFRSMLDVKASPRAFDLLEVAYRRALHLVRRHERECLEIAACLRGGGTLDKKDLARIMGPPYRQLTRQADTMDASTRMLPPFF